MYFTLTDLKTWPTCGITWSIYLYRGPALRCPSGEINPAQSTDLCGFIGDDGDDGEEIAGVHNAHGSIADYAIWLVHMRGSVVAGCTTRGADTVQTDGVQTYDMKGLKRGGVGRGDEKGDSGQ